MPRKEEPPIQLRDLIRSIEQRTDSRTVLERLDVAVRYGELLRSIEDDLVGHFVEEARRAGASWTQIGERLGVTKQAAHQRHVHREPRLFGRRRPREPFFPRLGQGARDVVVRAQDEARSFKHNYIGVEHLLLALTTKAGGNAASILRDMGVTTERVEAEIDRIVGTGTEAPLASIPFTPRSKAALQMAVRSTGRSGRLAGPAHLLLGILELRSGMGVEILDALEVSTNDLRKRTESALNAED
jgi:hypothetical protein